MDGEPPDLPIDKFSEAARDFVRRTLNKIPKLRPTYATLLQHPWLAPLQKEPTIAEEDEDVEDEDVANEEISLEAIIVVALDKEVAQWVLSAMERKRNGKMGKKVKPALHAAPLDAVPSPSPDAANK